MSQEKLPNETPKIPQTPEPPDALDHLPKGKGNVKAVPKEVIASLLAQGRFKKVVIPKLEEQKEEKQTEDTLLNVPENIENTDINIEQSIEKHIEFYTRYSIPIPPNFREQIIDIWNRNYTEMVREVKEKGFDELLIMPANLTMTPELDEKMTAGYLKKDGKPGDPTKWDIDMDKIKPAIPDRLTKNRILLVHKKDSQDIYNNPTAPQILQETLNKPYTAFKPEEGLTIEEYFVFQRMYFEETGKHLDDTGWTWLRCSTNEDGSRVIRASWDLGSVGLYVVANVSSRSDGYLGCRLARSFD